jgi:hypothetical protein
MQWHHGVCLTLSLTVLAVLQTRTKVSFGELYDPINALQKQI